MKNTIKESIYKHYKGKYYKVVGIARHSESLEYLVIYQKQYGDFGLWARPKKMFLEKVKVNGKLVPRFKKVNQKIVIKPSKK